MTQTERTEMGARAYEAQVAAGDNWAQCPHERPFERCDFCTGDDSLRLLAEVDRLRALIKAAEMHGSGDRCPWCLRWEDEPHRADCAAFAKDGGVR